MSWPPAFFVVRADLRTPQHAAAWRAATQAYANDPMGGSQTLSAEVLERNVAALATWPTAVVFLAFTGGGDVAGLATCFRGWGTFQAKPLLNVHDLAVLPAFRRRGVGRALLQHVIVHAQLDGCGKVTLEMVAANAKARALYESLGFDLSLVFGELRLDGSACLGSTVH